MRDKIKSIMDKAYEEGRKNLTEVEVYEIFKILGLEIPLYVYSDKKDFQKDSFYKKITDTIKTDKIVLKMVSYTNLHKTDSGGVRIADNNLNAIDNAVSDILKIKEVAKKQGTWDLRASGWRKVLAGVTSVDEMLATTIVEM